MAATKFDVSFFREGKNRKESAARSKKVRHHPEEKEEALAVSLRFPGMRVPSFRWTVNSPFAAAETQRSRSSDVRN